MNHARLAAALGEDAISPGWSNFAAAVGDDVTPTFLDAGEGAPRG